MGQFYCEFISGGEHDHTFASATFIGVASPELDVESCDATRSPLFWGVSRYAGTLIHLGERRSFLGGELFKFGQTLGLLLDSTKGSLTVYKDGTRLGVAVEEGLVGMNLCWAVVLSAVRQSVTVKPSPPPDDAAALELPPQMSSASKQRSSPRSASSPRAQAGRWSPSFANFSRRWMVSSAPLTPRCASSSSRCSG
jgi:hypothetical protein